MSANPPRVRIGGPAHLIADETRKADGDLLVVGAHPHSPLARIFLRSTVQEILQVSPCAILVPPQPQTTPIKRILVAIDLSMHSDAVLEKATAIARLDGADLRILYVEDPVTDLALDLTMRDHRRLRHKARAHFTQLVEAWDFPSGLHVESRVRSGRVGRTILKEAARWDADLVVVGSRRCGWLRSSILGSVSLRVLRSAQRATMIVPKNGCP